MPYRAFVSSTFIDLEDHREVVIRALRKAGFDVDPMEDWTASTDEPKAFSQERVEGCDLCVLLVALRRGHVPEDSNLSITQMEYRAAVDAGIDVLVFMLDESAPWSRGFDELDSDPQIREWRAELLEKYGVGIFGFDTASVEIAPALTRWLTERQERAAAPVTGERRSGGTNILGRARLPFVGRDKALLELAALLDDPEADRVALIHGPPGVGKSELAKEFGRIGQERYPGGRFIADCSSGSGHDIANIGVNRLGLTFPAGLPVPDQCEQTLVELWKQPSLLIFDNPPSYDAVCEWLPPHGEPCHVLITSTNGQLIGPGFPSLPLAPLDDAAARELIAEVTSEEIARSEAGDRLLAHAGGLPIQLLPVSEAMEYEASRGRSLEDIAHKLADPATNSFEFAYDALGHNARLVLHAIAELATDRVERGELDAVLHHGFDWSAKDVSPALDECCDRHLVDGIDQLRMHQLVASYVRSIKPSRLSTDEADRIASARSRALVAAAEAVVADPANRSHHARLLSHQTNLESHSALTDAEDLGALLEIGRFDEARPWYEKAITQKEQGDTHGRVDHASLGTSLHLIGYCYTQTGDHNQARPWYEKAVTQKEQGDTHGRIDHASLGTSLHQVGYCYSQTGDYNQARPWYEKAVAQAEQGDIHGRINHASLGTSLHQVGYCYSQTRDYNQARPWYEKAVAQAEQGDTHGRINHASLGTSLHQVGDCYTQTGDHNQARTWYEKAVAQAEQGDIHGRVNHESLGASLHLIGYCYTQTGDYNQARPWYEKAVTQTEQGDIHGRVNHENLGASLHQVGYCYTQTGDHNQARPWYEKAVTQAEQGDIHGRVNHESLEISREALAECLRQLGE